MLFSKKNLVLLFVASVLTVSAYADATKKTFKSVSEAASIITGGNTDLKTYLVKTDNVWKWTNNALTLKGDYTYGESNEVRSAERWSIGLRYDRYLNDRLSVYLGEVVEANRFAGFRRRFNTDLGAKYILINTDKTKSFAEAGARYTIEQIRDQDDFNDWKGRAYYEISRKFSEAITGRFWAEYIPNFSRSEDYLLNFEPSIAVTMSSNLSLKFAFLFNYDNAPALGNGKQDYGYTTGIIANF